MSITTHDSRSAFSAGFPSSWTLADLHAQLGDVPLNRILLVPTPGTATEDDVLAAREKDRRICELIDGTLVEKTMGYYESILAGLIAYLLHRHLEDHPAGKVLVPDGTLRILPNQVRAPDISFIARDRLPPGPPSDHKIPAVAPNLAIEVLSEGNTPAEMQRKLREYFTAGVQLVWYVDPRNRTATAYTSPTDFAQVGIDGHLDGGAVLPGFRLSLKELFERADETT